MTTSDEIKQAVNIAKKNAKKVTERKLDLARADTHAEIIELKTEIAALKGTSTTKDPAPSFNPAAKEFTPQQAESSDSTHTSIPICVCGNTIENLI